MKPIAALYAPGEGPPRRLAELLSAKLRGLGRAAEPVEAQALPPGFNLRPYAGALLIAGVRGLRPQAELVALARAHRAALEQMPAGLVSVSVWPADAAAEGTTSRADRMRAAAVVEEQLARFLEATGWRVSEVRALAGLILHTRDGGPARVVMKVLDPRSGRAVDAGDDHVYTDLDGLDHFLACFVGARPEPSGSARERLAMATTR